MNLPTPSPVKARPITLSHTATAEAAFIAMLDACLNHAVANRPAVLDGQSEGVHQMRVAFRRLRSGLKLFRPIIPKAASATWVEEIRWLNGFLGPTRDWDVFVEEGLAPLWAHFPRKRGLILFQAKAERLRQQHRRTLCQILAEPRAQQLLEGLHHWLEHRTWREALDVAQGAALEQPVLDFATPLLERSHQQVMKQGERFESLTAEQRHALRIRIKELRYALDFFASLYPTPAVKAYATALADLQGSLGILNDIAVAHRLLDEAGLKPISAARQVIDGWYGHRLHHQQQAFAELWRNFKANEPPWANSD